MAGEQARAAATAFNTLMDRVAADADYLEATLAAAAEYDEFTVRTEHSMTFVTQICGG